MHSFPLHCMDLTGLHHTALRLHGLCRTAPNWIALPCIALHCSAQCCTAPHHTAFNCPALHAPQCCVALHTLHFSAQCCAALRALRSRHSAALIHMHCIAPHSTALLCTALPARTTLLPCTTAQNAQLHSTALPLQTLHYAASLPCRMLHCIALHYIALRCAALHATAARARPYRRARQVLVYN